MSEKMYLVECEADNSLTILEEDSIMSDVTQIFAADEVKFFYKKQVCTGHVLCISGKNFRYFFFLVFY